jgi:hypothetical protein
LDYAAMLTPNSGEVAFHRGVVLHHNKQTAEALNELKRARKIGGKMVDVELADRLINELETNAPKATPVSLDGAGVK